MGEGPKGRKRPKGPKGPRGVARAIRTESNPGLNFSVILCHSVRDMRSICCNILPRQYIERLGGSTMAMGRGNAGIIGTAQSTCGDPFRKIHRLEAYANERGICTQVRKNAKNAGRWCDDLATD